MFFIRRTTLSIRLLMLHSPIFLQAADVIEALSELTSNELIPFERVSYFEVIDSKTNG